MSADLKYVLLYYDLTQIYRYSFEARYKIYDLESKRLYHLWPLNKYGEKISFATWGPKGNQMAYVYKNDIYYVPKVNGTHYAVTNNGVEGVVFNGIPDWLYEVIIQLLIVEIDAKLKTEGRGSSDKCVTEAGKIAVVKWCGNRTDIVKRWSKKDVTFLEVSRPEVVKFYNKSMGDCGQAWLINAIVPNSYKKKFSSQIALFGGLQTEISSVLLRLTTQRLESITITGMATTTTVQTFWHT
ncbi:Inactive dipeptidyl peptidase 10 [Araneus ventricosus]|uniref:Inactive dipeptidyl peptidase 10 n=1 Tax=Araneus ventricosus TaxID=182803 RepID=A0A4Y2D2A4_ARAVE|nr:Inactive dipeptidyl peptidase 10 [Araneus ventricosus]